jgi:hypothetical protein
MCKDCNCPKYKEYYEKHKDEIKKKNAEKYEKNREYKLKQVKEYQERNKEIIHAKRVEKVKCVCGGHYQKKNKSIHIKTKMHKEYESKQAI